MGGEAGKEGEQIQVGVSWLQFKHSCLLSLTGHFQSTSVV